MQGGLMHSASTVLAAAFVAGVSTFATAQPVSLQALNGQWMVAEGGGGGTVNANRDTAGVWETFTLEDFNGGDLNDGDQVAFRTQNGSYLQAQNGGGGAFLAVGGGAWSHETFTVVLLSGSDNRVDNDELVALRSVHGYYVVAEDGGGAIVNCDRTAIGPWEEWRVRFGEPPPPGPTSLTILVNGSFNESPEWVQPGSDAFNAIAATYGAPPMHWSWTSNSLGEVIPPFYNGIVDGGFALANFLHNLPPGDVNLISHSHGGNVVLMSQAWSTRAIRRYIQLATPVNWDFGDWRYALNYGIAGRCQASSSADWKQFFGASPYQVGNFFYHVYQSVQGAIEAFEALINGDYDSSFLWFAESVFDAIQADYWLDTTRIEVEGPTFMFSGLSHAALHEPPVWNVIAPWCQ
jgi:hypothetical protein